MKKKNKSLKKRYTFTVYLTGEGETLEEAWEDVFSQNSLEEQLDTEDPPTTYVIEEIEE